MQMTKKGTSLIVAGGLVASLAIALVLLGAENEPVSGSSVGRVSPVNTPQSVVLGQETFAQSAKPLRSIHSHIVLQGDVVDMPELAKTGAGWFMLSGDQAIVWGEIETSAGQFRWDALDEIVAQARQNGFHLVLTIAPYAGWDYEACHSSDEADFTTELPEAYAEPCDVGAFSFFVDSLIERYAADSSQTDLQHIAFYLPNKLTRFSTEFHYAGDAQPWNALQKLIQNAAQNHANVFAWDDSWYILPEVSPVLNNEVDAFSSGVVTTIARLFTEGASKIVIPEQNEQEGQALRSAVRTFIQSADQFTKVQKISDSIIIFSLPNKLERWIAWGGETEQQTLQSFLQGQVRVSAANGTERIMNAEQVQLSASPVIIAPLQQVDIASEQSDAKVKIEHLSLAALEQGKPSQARTVFSLNEDIVLVVRMQSDISESVTATFSLAQQDGGILVPNSQIQLINGEIGVPKPSALGKYILTLQVSQQEVYHLNFEIVE
ncbi:MAG: hypothetical protein H6760_01720 [Candidatus Nomurabacteria bacterium]|nr:MAG: hypothetical protein H6760_01720 [Candidatus Nomurabacteria bacterium]